MISRFTLEALRYCYMILCCVADANSQSWNNVEICIHTRVYYVCVIPVVPLRQ